MEIIDINILDWDVCTCEYTSPCASTSAKSWVQELWNSFSTSTNTKPWVQVQTYSSTTSLIFTCLDLPVIQKRHLTCKKSCRTFKKSCTKIFELWEFLLWFQLLHPMWHFLAKFWILYHSACSFRSENFLMIKPLLSSWESNLNLLIAKPDSKTLLSFHP